MSDLFDWDDANIGHLAAHSVTPAEAEYVLIHDPLEEYSHITNQGEHRYNALGITATGRELTISFTERGKKIRPITAWEMTQEERKRWLKNR